MHPVNFWLKIVSIVATSLSALDLIRRGISGLLKKKILIFRLGYFIGDEGGSIYKVYNKKNDKWMDNDTKYVYGNKAIVYGIIYSLVGLILFGFSLGIVLFFNQI